MFVCGYYVCLRQAGEWGIGALKRFFWLGAKGIGEPKNLSRQVGTIAMSEAFFSGSFIYFGNRECGLGGLSGSIMFVCGYYVCLRQAGEWGIGALKRFFWLGAKGIGEPKNLSRQAGTIAMSEAFLFGQFHLFWEPGVRSWRSERKYYVCLRILCLLAASGRMGNRRFETFFWLGAKGIGEPKNLSRQVGTIAMSEAFFQVVSFILGTGSAVLAV